MRRILATIVVVGLILIGYFLNRIATPTESVSIISSRVEAAEVAGNGLARIILTINNPSMFEVTVVGSTSNCGCIRVQSLPVTISRFSDKEIIFELFSVEEDRTQQIKLHTNPPIPTLVSLVMVPKGLTNTAPGLLKPVPDPNFVEQEQ